MIAQLDKTFLKFGLYAVYKRLLSYLLFEGRPVTTRGRWINPLVFLFLKIVSRFGFGKKVVAPVFIVGTGRSGTTILGKLLSIHPDVGFLNEPKALWHVVNPEEDIIGNYTCDPASLPLSAEDVTPPMLNKAHNVYASYLRLALADKVVDKYPELVFRYDYVKTIFPDARFIFLARNGYDTCVSIDTWSQRHGGKESGTVEDWWGVDGRKWEILIRQVVSKDDELNNFTEEILSLKGQVERASVEWAISMKAGLKIAGSNPDSVMLLRYEDLVSSPDESMIRILDFCKLSHDRNTFNYAREVLRQSLTDAGHLELNEHVRPLFERIMKELDYL